MSTTIKYLKTNEQPKRFWRSRTRSQQLVESIKPDPMLFPGKSLHLEVVLRSNTQPTRAIYRENGRSTACTMIYEPLLTLPASLHGSLPFACQQFSELLAVTDLWANRNHVGQPIGEDGEKDL